MLGTQLTNLHLFRQVRHIAVRGSANFNNCFSAAAFFASLLLVFHSFLVHPAGAKVVFPGGGGGGQGFRFSDFPSSSGAGLLKRRDDHKTTGPEGGTSILESDLLALAANSKPKRSYVNLQCRGMYNQGILAQLERICEDCYNLYKDAEVHGYCRMDCFGSQTFRQCLQSLLLDKESDFYLELVDIVGKKKRKR